MEFHAVQSIYCVQTKVIPLSDVPFQNNKYYTKEYARITSPFFLFDNCNCIKHRQVTPYGKVPFIPFLGRLIINTRQFYYNRPSYLHDDSKRDNFLTYAVQSENSNYCAITGFNNSLIDQRLGTIYYELEKPILIKSIINSICVIGKVFLHLYPSGHLIIHIAYSCCLNGHDGQIVNIIKNTKPWNINSSIVWSCPIQKETGNLSYILKKIYEKIAKFIFIADRQDYFFDRESKQKWVLSIDFNLPFSSTYQNKGWNDISAEDIIKSILKKSGVISNADQSDEYTNAFFRTDIYDDDNNYDDFYISRNGCYYLTDPNRNRQKRLKSFWKLMHLVEVALYCKTNLIQYIMYFEQDSISINTRLYDKKNALLPKSMFEKSHFDGIILTHIFRLKFFSQELPPFYQKLWYLLTEEQNIDELQEKTEALVQQWLDNVEKLSNKDSLIKVLFNIITHVGKYK